MSSILRVSNLNKHFGQLHVLKNISFEVNTTEVVCIIGRSGSGKSTLLRCINFLEEPDSGSIEADTLVIKAQDASRDRERQIHSLRLITGMVFQSFNLFSHMTVLDNVIEGPVTVKRMNRTVATEIGLHYLEKVELVHKCNEYPGRLSGGQQQRVAIARALAMDPKIMLFDEPTSALDPVLTSEVLDVMQQLVEDGMTMIVVTHEIGFAREFANRIIHLDDGCIVEVGSPKQLLETPQDHRTQNFLKAFTRFGQPCHHNL
jgi:L-cystine transport system ATP-binding protein